MTTTDPEGRSYIVSASDAAMARAAARSLAAIEGHPSPQATILHIEDIGPGRFGSRRFEVVIATKSRPATTPHTAVLDTLLSLAEAAESLGVASSTLRNQANAGRLHGRVIGKTWITTIAEVERYRIESLGRPGRKPGGYDFGLPPDEAQRIRDEADAADRRQAIIETRHLR